MRLSFSSALFSTLVVGSLLVAGCGPSDSGDGEEDGGSAPSTTDGGSSSSSSSSSDSSAPLNVTVEWASLKGRFVYDGKAPEQAPINMGTNPDRMYCGEFNPVQETLVVNKESGGLRDVVIFLRDKAEKIHPDYEATATGMVHLDNEHCRFHPHVCLLRTTQTLDVGNKDKVGHNTKIDPFSNPGVNRTIAPGDTAPFEFPKEEARPANVSCTIHPWMSAYLVVRDNPYFAVTDENGDFEIKNLPGGKWEMQVWHPKAGYVDEVNLGGKKVKWSKGRVDAIIDDGDEDWGEVKLAPALFEK